MVRLASVVGSVVLATLAACSALTSLDDLHGSDASSDAPSNDGGVAPVQITTRRAHDLVVDGTTLFWTEPFDSAIGSLQKGSTTPTYIAIGTAGFFPSSIQTDAANVYWASGTGKIFTCAKSGCANVPSTLFDGAPPDGGLGGIDPILMGVDATSIYFYDAAGSPTRMYVVPIAGGAASQVGPAICSSPNAAQLIGNQIYITCADGTIGRFDPVQGVVSVLTNASPPAGAGPFTIQSNILFYGQFFAMPGGAIYEVDATKTNGTPVPLATGQNNVASITYDATYLYWTTIGTVPDNGEGTLVRCAAVSCSSPTTLLDAQDEPTSIAIVGTTIYWTNYGNGQTPNVGLWMMPKPP